MTKSTLDPKVEKQLRELSRKIRSTLSASVTSPKKARSSAANGKLGGRPRKLATA